MQNTFTIEEDYKLAKFLNELTELSHKYQLGVVNELTVFVMENEDLERVYQINENDQVEFI